MLKALTNPMLAVGGAIIVVIVAVAVAVVLNMVDMRKLDRQVPAVALRLYPDGDLSNDPRRTLYGRIKVTTKGDVTVFELLDTMPGDKRYWTQRGGAYRVEPMGWDTIDSEKRRNVPGPR